MPPVYRDVGFSVARFGENSPGDDNTKDLQEAKALLAELG